MNSIDKLTEHFKQFPGVGPRQAKRFVYYLLRKNAGFSQELVTLIPQLKQEIGICSQCFRYMEKGSNSSCKVCSNHNREQQKLMIVTQDVDIDAVERSDSYNGLYFVLGGMVPILDKEPSKFVRITELKTRLDVDSQISEIILALPANPEGDSTSEFLKKELKEKDITISILGRGLSTGTELEYSDPETIKSALENRA